MPKKPKAQCDCPSEKRNGYYCEPHRNWIQSEYAKRINGDRKKK